MKKSLLVKIIVILGLITMFSCESNPNQGANGNSDIDTAVDSQCVMRDLAKGCNTGDTLKTDFYTSNVDLDSLQITMKTLNDEVNELETSNWVILSFIVLFILFTIFVLKKFRDISIDIEDEKEKREDLNLIREKKITHLENELKKLKSEHLNLNLEVDKLKIVINKTKNNQVYNEKKQLDTNVSYNKIYATSVSKGYFNELSKSSEGCLFVITPISNTRATFDIISVQKISSSVNWRDAVDFNVEKCKIEDAKGHEVDVLGECEKDNYGDWKVVKKLKIRIHK